MGSDINEGTAALLVFVGEYAPGGYASAANSHCLGVVNFTQFVLYTHLFNELAV